MDEKNSNIYFEFWMYFSIQSFLPEKCWLDSFASFDLRRWRAIGKPPAWCPSIDEMTPSWKTLSFHPRGTSLVLWGVGWWRSRRIFGQSKHSENHENRDQVGTEPTSFLQNGQRLCQLWRVSPISTRGNGPTGLTLFHAKKRTCVWSRMRGCFQMMSSMPQLPSWAVPNELKSKWPSPMLKHSEQGKEVGNQ